MYEHNSTIKNRAFIHYNKHYNIFDPTFVYTLCPCVTYVVTLFFQGKWIWGTCPSEGTTAQRNSLILDTGSSLWATASAPCKYFQHKLSGLSLFPEFQEGVLPHRGERMSPGRYTAPETTHRHRERRRMSTFPGSDPYCFFISYNRKQRPGPVQDRTLRSHDRNWLKSVYHFTINICLIPVSPVQRQIADWFVFHQDI